MTFKNTVPAFLETKCYKAYCMYGIDVMIEQLWQQSMYYSAIASIGCGLTQVPYSACAGNQAKIMSDVVSNRPQQPLSRDIGDVSPSRIDAHTAADMFNTKLMIAILLHPPWRMLLCSPEPPQSEEHTLGCPLGAHISD